MTNMGDRLRLLCIALDSGGDLASIDRCSALDAVSDALRSPQPLSRRRALFVLERLFSSDAFAERFSTAFSALEFETDAHLLEAAWPLCESVLSKLADASEPSDPESIVLDNARGRGWGFSMLERAMNSPAPVFQRKAQCWILQRGREAVVFARQLCRWEMGEDAEVVSVIQRQVRLLIEIVILPFTQAAALSTFRVLKTAFLDTLPPEEQTMRSLVRRLAGFMAAAASGDAAEPGFMLLVCKELWNTVLSHHCVDINADIFLLEALSAALIECEGKVGEGETPMVALASHLPRQICQYVSAVHVGSSVACRRRLLCVMFKAYLDSLRLFGELAELSQTFLRSVKLFLVVGLTISSDVDRPSELVASLFAPLLEDLVGSSDFTRSPAFFDMVFDRDEDVDLEQVLTCQSRGEHVLRVTCQSDTILVGIFCPSDCAEGFVASRIFSTLSKLYSNPYLHWEDVQHALLTLSAILGSRVTGTIKSQFISLTADQVLPFCRVKIFDALRSKDCSTKTFVETWVACQVFEGISSSKDEQLCAALSETAQSLLSHIQTGDVLSSSAFESTCASCVLAEVCPAVMADLLIAHDVLSALLAPKPLSETGSGSALWPEFRAQRASFRWKAIRGVSMFLLNNAEVGEDWNPVLTDLVEQSCVSLEFLGKDELHYGIESLAAAFVIGLDSRRTGTKLLSLAGEALTGVLNSGLESSCISRAFEVIYSERNIRTLSQQNVSDANSAFKTVVAALLTAAERRAASPAGIQPLKDCLVMLLSVWTAKRTPNGDQESGSQAIPDWLPEQLDHCFAVHVQPYLAEKAPEGERATSDMSEFSLALPYVCMRCILLKLLEGCGESLEEVDVEQPSQTRFLLEYAFLALLEEGERLWQSGELSRQPRQLRRSPAGSRNVCVGTKLNRHQVRIWQSLAVLVKYAAASLSESDLDRCVTLWETVARDGSIHHSVRYHLEGFSARLLTSNRRRDDLIPKKLCKTAGALLGDALLKPQAAASALLLASGVILYLREKDLASEASALETSLAACCLAWSACPAGHTRSLANVLLLEISRAGILGRHCAAMATTGNFDGDEVTTEERSASSTEIAIGALVRFLVENPDSAKMARRHRSIFHMDFLKKLVFNHSVTGLVETGMFGGPSPDTARHLLEAIEDTLKGFKAGRQEEAGTNSAEVSNELLPSLRLQRKVVPWDVLELAMGEKGTRKTDQAQNRTIVVASLIDKAPNLAGLARTCEIFGCERLCLDNLDVVHRDDFKSIAVTAAQWIEIEEVKAAQLRPYLADLRDRGYTVIAVEQTADSVSLSDFRLADIGSSKDSDPKVSPSEAGVVLLLGEEKRGVPMNLLEAVDICVEIPQLGILRSLNVHVSGAVALFELLRQRMALRRDEHDDDQTKESTLTTGRGEQVETA